MSSDQKPVHCWVSLSPTNLRMAADLSLPEWPFCWQQNKHNAKDIEEQQSCIGNVLSNLVYSGSSSTEAIICSQVCEWEYQAWPQFECVPFI